MRVWGHFRSSPVPWHAKQAVREEAGGGGGGGGDAHHLTSANNYRCPLEPNVKQDGLAGLRLVMPSGKTRARYAITGMPCVKRQHLRFQSSHTPAKLRRAFV